MDSAFPPGVDCQIEVAVLSGSSRKRRIHKFEGHLSVRGRYAIRLDNHLYRKCRISGNRQHAGAVSIAAAELRGVLRTRDKYPYSPTSPERDSFDLRIPPGRGDS